MAEADLASALSRSINEATPHTRNVFGGPHAMSAAEVAGFLQESHVALISTVTSSGAPHITALYILALDGKLYIGTFPRAALYRNLRRNPKVAIAVVELPWQRHVFVYGSVRFVPQEGEEIDRVRAAQRARFGGERGAILAEVVPDKLFTWKM